MDLCQSGFPKRTPPLLALSLLILLSASAGAAQVPDVPSPRPSGPGAMAITPVSPPMVAPSSASPKVAYIPLRGMIDDHNDAYFKRAMDQAVALGVSTVVVHLTTDGGTFDAGRRMAQTAMGVPEGHPLVVAFIDHRAYSAGSMIAYAMDRIYLTKLATIGDIGVITYGAGGKIEYAPEKIQTVARTLLRSEAIDRGWDVAKMEKMCAVNQDLYRFTVSGGSQFVLEDDLPSWLAAHPGIAASSRVLILGHDRLISYTADEAVKEGMATGLVKDLPDLYASLGTTPADVIDLSPTPVERVSWAIQGWAPLMSALAIIFLILQLKSPGHGMWGIASAICGAAFLVCQYYQGMVGNLDIIIVALGLAMMLAELHFPTHGILVFSGLGLAVVGLVMCFVPTVIQDHPFRPGFADALLQALTNSALSLFMVGVGLVLIIRMLPHSRLIARLTNSSVVAGSSAGEPERSASLVGRQAVARTDLRPTGFIVIDGKDVSAICEHGEALPAGTAVGIVAMRLGEAVVKALPPEVVTSPTTLAPAQAGPGGAA